MHVRVFLNSPGPVTCEAFNRLGDGGLATVVGCLATTEQARLIRQFFASPRIIEREALFADGLGGTFRGADTRLLTPELLESLHWAEGIAYEMMDRIDTDRSQRFRERRDLFLYLVAFWTQQVHELDIDVFYSQETPHEVADFVLFAVMKSLGRQTLLFSRTLILGEWFFADDYRYPRTVFHWPPGDPRRSVRAADDDETILERHIATVRGSYSEAMAAYLNYMNAVVDDTAVSPAADRFGSLLRRGRTEAAVVTNGINSMARTFGEVRRRPGPTVPNALARVAHAWLTYASAQDLATTYPRHAHLPDTESPFVYFLLGYQPENTNCPEGARFGNQLLAVSLLARCLPPGWRIVVKEHPAQLANQGRGASGYGNLGREASLYESLSRIPDVEMASIESDHFHLVDSSSAVATLTGTAGWEAAVRGKPVLCFGEAWYQSAPNVQRIRTTQDCERCLEAVAKEELLSGADLDAALVSYIREVTQRTHTMVLNEWDAEVTGLPFDLPEQRATLERIFTGYIDGSLTSSSER